MEIDPARSPEPHHLSPTTDPGSIPTLDGWIENLMACKQLAEDDVRRLCDRVRFFLIRVVFDIAVIMRSN
jgi:serine/threonine-protein phosphatase 2A catalytic subunit